MIFVETTFDIFPDAARRERPIQQQTRVTTPVLRAHPKGVPLFCFITIHY